MRNYSMFAGFAVIVLPFLVSCNSGTKSNFEKSVNQVSPFPLSEVTLLDGPFKTAMELDKKTLLKYDPDRFLSRFRTEAGMKPKAPPYQGWEAESIAGHSLGHYLSACAMMYQSSHDTLLRERVKYIVNELDSCQTVDGDGYIGAIPNGKKILEEEVAKGDIRAQAFDLNGIWAPFYTAHKVMAGLRDAYHLCGLKEALKIEQNFADWLYKIVDNLDSRQIQNMLVCEHGGMNEVLADLYADTDNPRYLDLSRVFHHKAILDSLAAGIDVLPNKHANTQIPKVIGVARRYEITGNLNDKKTAEFFWEQVVRHHSYVTGGHGNHEYFGQPDQLRNRLSHETTETCNVYNMLKLSRHLFQWHPRAEIADYYERALFNHILSSQNPIDGHVVYYLSLEMGGFKSFQDPDSFTCCIGTGMENHAKYGRNIFYKNDSELYVSQFISAIANWKEKGIAIKQLTKFPEEQGTTIEMEMSAPREFSLHIRYPYWAVKGFTILVNGAPHKIDQEPGSFIAIRRTWNSGDKVDVKMPFTLRLEGMPDDNNRVAILYGPLVLAGVLGPVDYPAADQPDYVPILFTEDRNPEHWLRSVKGAANTFEVATEVARPRSFMLKPFYTVYNQRYSVYWDIFSKETWQQHTEIEKAEQEREKELAEKTVDFFQPGETHSELTHAFNGEGVRMLDFRHKTARVADRGGWFSFEMNVLPEKAMALVVHYWGGFTGSKTFDILVEGKKIATENIAGKKDGQFIDIRYDIPAALTAGKKKITVEFKPHTGHRAGPIFGVRTIPG